MSGRLVIAGVAIALALSGCLGGGGDEEVDPRAALDAAFANPVPSADIEAQLDADLAGVPLLAGRPIRIRADGPYVAGDRGGVPSVNWKIDAGAGGFSLGADLISTGDNAFVRFDGDTFELGPERLAGARPAIDVDPRAWFGQPALEGDEGIEGTDTDHISAPLDTRHFAADLESLLGRLDVDAAGIRFEPASVDLWIGKDDDLVRRLSTEAGFAIPPKRRGALAGVSAGTLKLDVTLTDVGEKEAIAAPPGPYRPIEELREELPLLPGL